MRRLPRTATALLTALAVVIPGAVAPWGAATAGAQPLDPYGPDPGARPPDGARTPDRDPEIDEAVAAALVARARELIAIEAWQDAHQLLGEALARSPGGASAAEARRLLGEVEARLGIARPPAGGDGGGEPGIGDPISWDDLDGPIGTPPPPPRGPEERAAGGRQLVWHLAGIGALVGGFVGDAATADLDPEDGIDESGSGGAVLGAVIGGVAGLGAGLALRQRARWITADDVVVIDSFAAMGLVGSLSLGALMQPAYREAYSVNAALGTTAGAITGLVIARDHDLSASRMLRVDLWAAGGAVAPWLLFALADGDADDAQTAGFFSIAGMVGGAWLGFRLTRGWDAPRGAEVDAPPALVRRGAGGGWALGGPSLRPAHLPSLGPALGPGAALSLFAGSF